MEKDEREGKEETGGGSRFGSDNQNSNNESSLNLFQPLKKYFLSTTTSY